MTDAEGVCGEQCRFGPYESNKVEQVPWLLQYVLPSQCHNKFPAGFFVAPYTKGGYVSMANLVCRMELRIWWGNLSKSHGPSPPCADVGTLILRRTITLSSSGQLWQRQDCSLLLVVVVLFGRASKTQPGHFVWPTDFGDGIG